MPTTLTRLKHRVDPIARLFGGYTAYELHPDEYVTTVNDSVAYVREVLYREGYEESWLTATKIHPGTGRLHELSMRKIPELHPFEVTGTRLDDYEPDSCQYHLHVFMHDDVVEYFSHYELRPLCHPVLHYRPEYGETYLMGVTDLEL